VARSPGRRWLKSLATAMWAARKLAMLPPPCRRTKPFVARAERPAQRAVASNPVLPQTDAPAPAHRQSIPLSRQSRSAAACPAVFRTARRRAPQPAAPGAAARPRAPRSATTPSPRARAPGPGAPHRSCRDADGNAAPTTPQVRRDACCVGQIGVRAAAEAPRGRCGSIHRPPLAGRAGQECLSGRGGIQ